MTLLLSDNTDRIVKSISSKTESIVIENLVRNIPSKTEIVLLGECTHGTKEFYEIRLEITKYLIMHNEFRILFLEAEWPDIYRVNLYIHGKGNDKNARESLGNIDKFPLWMWRNNVIVDLVEWLKEYNRDHNEKVYIFGIDCQQIYKSYNYVLETIKRIDMAYYMYISRYLSFFKKFKNERDYSKAIIDGRLKKHIETIPEILQDLLSNFQWEKLDEYLKNQKNLDLDSMDLISLEQHIEILVNAEEYFRKMVLEPPGSQASWNTRDQHMLMTIMKIRNRYNDITNIKDTPKCIVWAHNSHIGNSNATNRGGIDFSKNDTWNLGQMVEETFPYSYSIGFYTSIGEVTANSHSDNIPSLVYTLNKPCKYSYEWFFSKVSEKNDINSFYISLSEYRVDTGNKSSQSFIPQALDIEYVTLFSGSKITTNKEIDSEVISRNLDEGFTFIAKSRIVDKNGVVRLEMDNGGWITEYISNASTTLYCRPKNLPYPENLNDFFKSNLMQRWIGITYCKDTEIQSHYGNSNLAKQYNMVVYVNKSSAISYLE